MQNINKLAEDLTEQEICELFDTGIFNDICKGYIKILTEHQENDFFIMSEYSKILDRVSAEYSKEIYRING